MRHAVALLIVLSLTAAAADAQEVAAARGPQTVRLRLRNQDTVQGYLRGHSKDEVVIFTGEGRYRHVPLADRLMKDGQWTLDTFEFSDLKVIFPAEDTAVVAYKVHQKGELKGKPMDLQCADSTAWVKDGRAWKCALHTETILEQA